MFETLSAGEPDAILALIGKYREDIRPGKLDLGVGVYKDETGSTPVMRAVRKAEVRQIADQKTKTYLGLAAKQARDIWRRCRDPISRQTHGGDVPFPLLAKGTAVHT